MIEQFEWVTTIINPIIVAKFFETICISIFQHILNTRSQESGLLELVLTNFRIVKTNSQGILYLHYFV